MTAHFKEFKPIGFRGKVQVVATSGPFDKQLFNAGLTFLKLNKVRPVYDAAVFTRTGYLAGEASQRAAQLLKAFTDPEVEAVWAARGGYGALQMLQFLHERIEDLKKANKPLIGFSDVTILHSFLVEKCGLLTIHGPNITTLSEIDHRSQNHLVRLLQGRDDAFTVGDRRITVLQPGTARGVVKGGNLASLVSLLGTPWEPNFDNCILLLEETGEVPYRVDRLVTQLRLAGKFAKIRGLIIGECSYREHHPPVTRHIDPRLIVERSGIGGEVPVMADFPVGHGERNMALLLGAAAVMDTGAKTLSFRFA